MRVGRRSRRIGNAGFTLIEVLVAVAILGIGLGVILDLFSGGLRSARISEDYTRALWHGKAKMEEMLSTQEFSEGVLEDSFDSQFSWKSEVSKVTPPLGQQGTVETPLPVDLYKIVLTVMWPSGQGQRRLEMESLRAFKSSEGVK